METPPPPWAPAPVLGHPPSAEVSPELGGPLLCVTWCPRPLGLSLALSPLQPPPGCLSPGMRCPEPVLLQAGQCQLSQPLLTAEMLQSLHHLHGPELDSVQSVPVSCTGQPSSGPSTPGLASLVWSRGKGSPPSTSCVTAASAAQDAVLHCCRSALLACGHPGVLQDPAKLQFFNWVAPSRYRCLYLLLPKDTAQHLPLNCHPC